MGDFTPYQKKIVKRYYENYDSIKQQRLAELVTEIFLADGKKRDRLWKQVAEMLKSLEFPESRISHLLEKRDPTHLAGVLQELDRKQS